MSAIAGRRAGTLASVPNSAQQMLDFLEPWTGAACLPGLALAVQNHKTHGSGGSYSTASLPARTVVRIGHWSTPGPQILALGAISFGKRERCVTTCRASGSRAAAPVPGPACRASGGRAACPLRPAQRIQRSCSERNTSLCINSAANGYLGVHFMIGFDLDVSRSKDICGVFE